MTRQAGQQTETILGVCLGALIAGLFAQASGLPDPLRTLGVMAGLVLLCWCLVLALWDVVVPWLPRVPLVRIVLFVLLPLAALAALLIWALFSAFNAAGLLESGGMSEKLLPALIGAIIVAFGWVAGPIAQEQRRYDERAERRRDLIKAASTEIWALAKLSAALDVGAAKRELSAAFHRDRRHVIFAFNGRDFSILRRLVDQVELLRKDEIPYVIDVYMTLLKLDEMEEKFDSDTFRALPWDRRLKAADRYYDLIEALVPRVHLALIALGQMRSAAQLLEYAEAEGNAFKPLKIGRESVVKANKKAPEGGSDA